MVGPVCHSSSDSNPNGKSSPPGLPPPDTFERHQADGPAAVPPTDRLRVANRYDDDDVFCDDEDDDQVLTQVPNQNSGRNV